MNCKHAHGCFTGLLLGVFPSSKLPLRFEWAFLVAPPPPICVQAIVWDIGGVGAILISDLSVAWTKGGGGQLFSLGNGCGQDVLALCWHQRSRDPRLCVAWKHARGHLFVKGPKF